MEDMEDMEEGTAAAAPFSRGRISIWRAGRRMYGAGMGKGVLQV